MSAEDNKALVRRFYEAAGAAGRADEFFGPDFVDHSLPPGAPQGDEGVRQLAAMFYRAFPDLRVEVGHLVAEGDLVADHVTVSGTHQGEFMGVPATGKRVAFTGTNINRIANGKIAEHWGNSDQLALMQQLGLIPASGQTS